MHFVKKTWSYYLKKTWFSLLMAGLGIWWASDALIAGDATAGAAALWFLAGVWCATFIWSVIDAIQVLEVAQ